MIGWFTSRSTQVLLLSLVYSSFIATRPGGHGSLSGAGLLVELPSLDRHVSATLRPLETELTSLRMVNAASAAPDDQRRIGLRAHLPGGIPQLPRRPQSGGSSPRNTAGNPSKTA